MRRGKEKPSSGARRRSSATRARVASVPRMRSLSPGALNPSLALLLPSVIHTTPAAPNATLPRRPCLLGVHVFRASPSARCCCCPCAGVMRFIDEFASPKTRL